MNVYDVYDLRFIGCLSSRDVIVSAAICISDGRLLICVRVLCLSSRDDASVCCVLSMDEWGCIL